MDTLRYLTKLELQELLESPTKTSHLSFATLFILFVATIYVFSSQDPYNLRRFPAIHRSGISDAYKTGVWWRFFLPRLMPYTEEGYYKYSKNGEPFKVWISAFREWAYVLPPKYLARIKNQGVTELSFEELVNKYLLPRFSTGNVDNVEIQITSKLLNGNLTTIKPLVQLHTEVILEREIGRPREWKRLHAQDLTDSVIKYITSRIVFGDALAGNEPFLHALERYVSMVIPLSLALRFVSLGPLKHAFMWLIHWANRRDLATATRYVVELINERRRTQASKKLSEDEKPVDAIQWAMEQDIAEHLKKPEVIAHRILHQCSAIMQTPAVAMGHLLYDVASHPGCLDELREEITSCLAEDGGSGWTQNAMARMKKLDSFVQECFRMNSMVTPLTGWRVVTSDTFRFDDGLILPRGTLLTFPTIHVQNDPDIHPNPTKFDFLRFYRLKEEDRRAGVPSFNRDLKTEWLSFGYGRQACPGRFFAVRLLKTIVGELILRYDIRYAGGNRARPAVLDVEPITVPDRTVELEFRARV